MTPTETASAVSRSVKQVGKAFYDTAMSYVSGWSANSEQPEKGSEIDQSALGTDIKETPTTSKQDDNAKDYSCAGSRIGETQLCVERSLGPASQDNRYMIPDKLSGLPLSDEDGFCQCADGLRRLGFIEAYSSSRAAPLEDLSHPNFTAAERGQIRELLESCFGDGDSLHKRFTRRAEGPRQNVSLDKAGLTRMKAELEEKLANGNIDDFYYP